MANERTYPCLPCADIDGAIAFYDALGFTRTYRQLKPNPYAVVQREDLQVHLFGIAGFDPEQSYGNAIVVVEDPDALYQAFAAGLRAALGRLPAKGVPRITRPRKKYGTVYGFSVVDPGGNWLRVSRRGASESTPEATTVAPAQATRLADMLAVATRLGDAHGDEAKALQTLESALQRYPEAQVRDRAHSLLYHAELAYRLGDEEQARSSLAVVQSLELTSEERDSIASEVAHVAELLRGD